MQIRRVPVTHPDAIGLIEQVQQVYVERYGSTDETPVDPDEFTDPHGAFFVGYDDGVPVASGAWRARAVDLPGATRTAELKRMYVVPERQRRGLGRLMLAHLEQSAAAAGYDGLVLETGLRQPEAISMYSAAGYIEIAGYGYYRDAPDCACFATLLSDPPPR